VIEYVVQGADQTLVLADGVVEHLLSHRQTKRWSSEAGGQLFARISRFEIVIAEATGPRRSDKRTRISYQPDRKLEQEEINQHQQVGLAFVGDWHTHPELVPAPSGRDLASISECFRKSSHHLNAFVLVIVGTSASPKDLHVSLHNSGGQLIEFGGIHPEP